MLNLGMLHFLIEFVSMWNIQRLNIQSNILYTYTCVNLCEIGISSSKFYLNRLMISDSIVLVPIEFYNASLQLTAVQLFFWHPKRRQNLAPKIW